MFELGEEAFKVGRANLRFEVQTKLFNFVCLIKTLTRAQQPKVGISDRFSSFRSCRSEDSKFPITSRFFRDNFVGNSENFLFRGSNFIFSPSKMPNETQNQTFVAVPSVRQL